MNDDPVIPKKPRARTKKKVHQLRVKSKLEFNKFEKNIPECILYGSYPIQSMTEEIYHEKRNHKDPEE